MVLAVGLVAAMVASEVEEKQLRKHCLRSMMSAHNIRLNLMEDMTNFRYLKAPVEELVP